MKTIPLVLIAALAGSGIGAAMAYVSVGPLAGDQLATPKTDRLPSESRDQIPTPKATVNAVVHDFGTMQRGATRTHEFVVRNDGDAPLTLTAGDTTCKCTSFTVSMQMVPPGGEALARLEWVAKSLPGAFRQSAALLTNDPYNSRIDLSVEGDVVNATGLQPDEFSLGRVGVNDSVSSSIVVLSFEEEDLIVKAETVDVQQSADKFSLEVTPLPADELPDSRAKAGARVTLTTAPGLPIGVLTEWVTLRTNVASKDGEPDTLQVPVVGRVEGDLSIHGPGWSPENGVLALGIIDNSVGKKTKLRVSIKGPDAEGASLKVVEVDPPELKVTLSEPRKVREQVVHVPMTIEVPVGTQPMNHLNTGYDSETGKYDYPEGRIRISSTLPSTPEIELRVRFAIEDTKR